jgi:hypothetical protein
MSLIHASTRARTHARAHLDTPQIAAIAVPDKEKVANRKRGVEDLGSDTLASPTHSHICRLLVVAQQPFALLCLTPLAHYVARSYDCRQQRFALSLTHMCLQQLVALSLTHLSLQQPFALLCLTRSSRRLTD